MKANYKPQLYALGTILLWASAFPLTKIALTYFTIPAVGTLRYLIASLCFLVIGIVKKIGFPAVRDLPKFFLSGALGFTFYMITFNHASHALTSATGSVIIASAPIMTALLANLIFKEHIKLLSWGAIMIEFLGIIVLALWDGIFSMNSGIFWMLVAALCISCYNLFQRSFKKKYTALQATAYSVFCGAILLLLFFPTTVFQLKEAPTNQWFIILYMGVFPSALAYLWWAQAISTAKKTSDVTNFMFVTPFIASLLGFLLISEAPSLSTYLGGALILIGLILFQKTNDIPITNRKKKPKHDH